MCISIVPELIDPLKCWIKQCHRCLIQEKHHSRCVGVRDVRKHARRRSVKHFHIRISIGETLIHPPALVFRRRRDDMNAAEGKGLVHKCLDKCMACECDDPTMAKGDKG